MDLDTIAATGGDGGAPQKAGRKWVEFKSEITFGTILVLLAMVGTGITAVYTVGGSVQRLQDTIEHEVEIRTIGERNMGDRLDRQSAKEAADVVGLNGSLSSVREDMNGIRADVHTVLGVVLPGAAAEQRRR